VADDKGAEAARVAEHLVEGHYHKVCTRACGAESARAVTVVVRSVGREKACVGRATHGLNAIATPSQQLHNGGFLSLLVVDNSAYLGRCPSPFPASLALMKGAQRVDE